MTSGNDPFGPPPGYGPPPFGPAAPTPGAMTNPYAAPMTAPTTPWTGTMAGSSMKWLFLSGYGGFWLFGATGYGIFEATTGAEEMRSGFDAGMVLLVLGFACLTLVPVAVLVWLYQAWSSVPPEARYTNGGTRITPGRAIGFLFIPLFNYVWVFMANLGLCDSIDRVLLAHGGAKRAPRGLAIAACVTHLVPYCNLLVAPILWAIYMFQVDAARREMRGRMNQAM